jgi:hypothetical protein
MRAERLIATDFECSAGACYNFHGSAMRSSREFAPSCADVQVSGFLDLDLALCLNGLRLLGGGHLEHTRFELRRDFCFTNRVWHPYPALESPEAALAAIVVITFLLLSLLLLALDGQQPIRERDGDVLLVDAGNSVSRTTELALTANVQIRHSEMAVAPEALASATSRFPSHHALPRKRETY